MNENELRQRLQKIQEQGVSAEEMRQALNRLVGVCEQQPQRNLAGLTIGRSYTVMLDDKPIAQCGSHGDALYIARAINVMRSAERAIMESRVIREEEEEDGDARTG